MIVEKSHDRSMDGLPIGTILIWRGEWLRSPEDCWGRDRDPMPVLYRPGGTAAPMTCAGDWVDVTSRLFLEECYWFDLLRRRLLERGGRIDRLVDRYFEVQYEEDWTTRRPLTFGHWIDWLTERLLEQP
jgi:hypothetical protein